MMTEEIAASPFSGQEWDAAVARFMGSRVTRANLDRILGPVKGELVRRVSQDTHLSINPLIGTIDDILNPRIVEMSSPELVQRGSE